MEAILLVARFCLAGVFVVSGLAKLVDRAGSRRAILEFGLADRWAKPFGILLPLGELLVALLLIPTSTAWLGALGASFLLLLFIMGISYNLAQGKQPDCHCFGQLYSKPISWRTLMRNASLLAIAALILWQGPGASPEAWLSELSGIEVFAVIASVIVVPMLVGMAWLLFSLWQQQGRLLLKIEALEKSKPSPKQTGASTRQPAAGLPVGARAPDFTLEDVSGKTLTLRDLRARGKPILLIFADPNCAPCKAMLPDVSRWQREYRDRLSVALLSNGSLDENRKKAIEHGLTTVLVQQNGDVSKAYKAYGTPSAVLIDQNGALQSSVEAGPQAIAELVHRTLGLPASLAPRQGGQARPQPHPLPPAFERGDPAPAITLENLEGKQVRLMDYRGHDTLLLFWNPSCGFCRRMLADLHSWEADPVDTNPRLLIVSTGSVEANRALGLRSEILLDENFTIGSKFGAKGTPSAVLIDAEGKVASEVAVGAPAILALARYQERVSGTQEPSVVTPTRRALLH